MILDVSIQHGYNNNFAYCTLVMKGDSYIPGAVALAMSLTEHKSKYKKLCMVTDDVSKEGCDILKNVFDDVILVPYITKDTVPLKSEKQEVIYRKWINSSFTKWNLLKFTDYNKILFVDADIIMMDNCDLLFDLSTPAATFSLPWAEPFVPKGIVNYYGAIRHGAVVSYKSVKKGLIDGFVLAGSMVLLEPSKIMFDKFTALLDSVPKYGNTMCVSSFDEQSLSDLYTRDKVDWVNIHQMYNWMVGKWNWLPNKEIPKVYHYYNIKPWETPVNKWPDLVPWWNYINQYNKKYDNKVLEHGPVVRPVKYAYCTLVMKGDKYIPGAIALAMSLINVKSKYKRICMVTNDVSKEGCESLTNVYDDVIEVPYITKKSVALMGEHKDIYHEWMDSVYTKWNLLKFIDNDKILFVDADVIMMENCDELFDLHTPAATFSSPWVVPYNTKGFKNYFGVLKHAELVHHSKIKNALEKGFTCLGSLMLLKPDQEMFDKLTQLLNKTEIYGHEKSYSTVDEQAITEIYTNKKTNWINIHQLYNWVIGKKNWLQHNETPKVYHYWGHKPWEKPYDKTNYFIAWWNMIYKYNAKFNAKLLE
jgi:alpha-N-acetylglucosamine transferase